MVNAMTKSTIDVVIEKLDTAVMSGWAGAFFPDKGNNGKSKPKFTSASGGADEWAEQFNKREKRTINMQED
jgi:hypothetical protein